MSKTKTPTFDAVDTAHRVRQGLCKLATLPPDQQIAVRRELSHTGRLQTKLLRRGKSASSSPPRTSAPGGFYSC